jgi:hypothetical protein
MPVYVDTPIKRLGKFRTSRMVADSESELLSMVDSLGLRKKRIQRNLPLKHVKICDTERARAIEMGAIEISSIALSKAFVALSYITPA